MTEQADIPDGFEPVPTGLGFTDMLQPFYRCIDEGGIRFGLRVGEQHVNLMGICHGGVLLTLADVAAGTAVSHARGQMGGNPTVNLSLDFINSGKRGEWLQAELSEITLKRRFGFCNGLISSERGIVARFNGTFYLPGHEGMWQGERRPDATGIADG
ncbi:PaaI family thioesterase [Parahaliea mediterranea]|uniref:PaaI family thioesterase n=1 Tax=Parahaliea mediterranea TaxID=651086 RepID=A0A939IKE2_9GAMM|nr:PaaI family thioesterase [Parahaliea mediterranea]MBN7798659.1 PaaI family thioesterase [Parahaliea mediterranea]